MALGRLFRGLAENLDQTRKQKIADMGGLEDKMNSSFIPGSFTFPGGFNFLGGGFPNRGGFGKFMTGDLPGPVLGPDDFGSYVIPASDPTYSSGFDYARSIAGGMPMSQVIAPGVSYSPEQPMGYTQAQLNTAVGTTPVETPPPPPTREPDDPRYFGTGIGGVNIPVDRKDIPFRNIFGSRRGTSSLENLMNIGKLFNGGIDQDAINRPPIDQRRPMPPPPLPPSELDISGLDLTGYVFDPVTRKMIPNPLGNTDMSGKIPSVPTGGDFSIDREILERPMISGLENRDLMDVDSLITGVPTGRGFSVDREPIPLQDFGYGPGIMPPLPPIDIDKVIPPKKDDQLFIDDMPIIDERILMPPTLPPVDIPPVDIPFIPFIKPPSIMDRPLIMDTPTIMDRPTGGRFSIKQKRPMGLF